MSRPQDYPEFTFIYELHHDGKYYVGKANDPINRMVSHKSEAVTGDFSRKNQWLRKLLTTDLFPKLRIIEKVKYTIWETKERYWIAQYRSKYGYHNVLNDSDGGGETFTQGENNPSAKLIWDEVDSMRELYQEGQLTFEDLALKFRIHPQTVLNIITHKTWFDPSYIYEKPQKLKRMNPEVALIRLEHQEGVTPNKLAEKYGHSPKLIRQWLRNVNYTDPNWDPVDRVYVGEPSRWIPIKSTS